MSPTPSLEQELVLAARKYVPSSSVKVQAAAGAGKTSLLIMVAEAQSDARILYVTYSASLAEDAARRFPCHVDCYTGHALALRSLNQRAITPRLQMRLNGAQVAQILSIPDRRHLPARQLGTWALDTVRQFCFTADYQISEQHVGLRVDDGFAAEVAERAADLWAALTDEVGCRLPIEHDMYLKVWHLRGAWIPKRYDLILMDEAHDCNPVMLDCMQLQMAPVIWVGDHPQSIFLFRGSVNALRVIRSPEFFLMQSYRFGTNIAAVANGILKHLPNPPERPVLGADDIDSRVDPQKSHLPQTVVCRTNAGVLAEALASRGPLFVSARLGQLEQLASGFTRLANGEPARDVEVLSRFHTLDDLLDALADNQIDPELRMVGLLWKEYGPQLAVAVSDLQSRLLKSGEHAPLRIMSAHGSKGLTLPSCRLSDDFPTLSELRQSLKLRRRSVEQYEQEINLMYVAATRARYELFLSDSVRELVRLAPTPVAGLISAAAGAI